MNHARSPRDDVRGAESGDPASQQPAAGKKSRLAQQEQERAREIADSLSQLPQQQTDARRQLNEVERRIGTQTGSTPQNQAQNLGLQAESARLKALVDELELAQLPLTTARSCRGCVPSWRRSRASSWMHISRR